MLISAGFSDTEVGLRTVHYDTTNIQRYQNPNGRNGEAQLSVKFRGSNKRQLDSEPSTLVRTYESGTIQERGKDGNNNVICTECCPSATKRICVVRNTQAKERCFEVFGGICKLATAVSM